MGYSLGFLALDKIAVARALDRFRRAERALVELKYASDYSTSEAAWTDFLIASNGIFSQLEQGAKSSSKSVAWFGRVRHRQKKDPILRYIHFARNSDEHGIEYVTERHSDGGFNLKFGERHEFIIRPYDPATGVEGEESIGWAYGPHIKLARAKDRRYGDFCDPPYAFVDPPGEPHALGIAALQILSSVLSEAEDLSS